MSQEYCVLIKYNNRICVEPDCKKSARGNTDKCVAHGGGTRCIIPDCKVGALGKTGKCTRHGGGPMCSEPDCKTSAQRKTDKCKTYKCKKHGGGSKCIELDCTASSVGKTNKCISHGGGKRCVEPGCKVSSSGKTDKCKRHGGGLRCIEPDCKTSARNKSDRCILHGGGKRCVEPDCKVSAVAKSDKCVSHGGGKRCIEPYCKTSAAGNTGKCVSHGGGLRCPNCIDWIDSRSGSSSYDGYCVTCFKEIFPSDKRSKVIYRHSKEIMVRNTINRNFEGFIHDRPLYTGNCDCTHRRRIDHRKLIGNTILAIETDEFGHRGYNQKDEEIRYDDVYMIHSGKWIFIRFNPDSNVSKIDISDKLDKLIETMNECINIIELDKNTELVEIIKLYC